MFNDVNYVYGDQDVEIPLHLNFGKFMLRKLKKFGNDIALVNTNTKEELTYKDLVQQSVNVAVALSKLGVKSGDVVAFGSEKRNEFIPTVLAILYTGATYTPMEILIGRATLRHKLSVACPDYLICSNKFWDLYSDVLSCSDTIKTFIVLDDSHNKRLVSVKSLIKGNENVELFEPVEVRGQSDVAFILYSSGTTGMPKGVALTHLNCILNSLPGNFNKDSLKTVWIHAEWYHNYDSFMTFRFMIGGKKIVYHPDYTNEILVENIAEYKVNIAMLVPSSFAYLAKSNILDKFDLDSIEILYSRSSPLHIRTIEEVRRRFPNLKNIYQGYGMTEAGELTSEIWGPKGSKPGSVGTASPGIIMKVVDIKSGDVVGPNISGEIRLKGPNLMKGYIGIDPESYLDEKGFFKTGDLGYYDEDKYFYIVDRIKELIVYDGYKIAPLELETLLLLHPEVKEVGVVGKEDADMGELPTAFVVRQPGSAVSEEELRDYVDKEVAHYMQLKGGVVFINEIPRNPRGKVLRKVLREMLLNLLLNK